MQLLNCRGKTDASFLMHFVADSCFKGLHKPMQMRFHWAFGHRKVVMAAIKNLVALCCALLYPYMAQWKKMQVKKMGKTFFEHSRWHETSRNAKEEQN